MHSLACCRKPLDCISKEHVNGVLFLSKIHCDTVSRLQTTFSVAEKAEHMVWASVCVVKEMPSSECLQTAVVVGTQENTTSVLWLKAIGVSHWFKWLNVMAQWFLGGVNLPPNSNKT